MITKQIFPYRKHLNLGQHGDTLIEIIFATVIIGSILTSAYALSSRAFQLGQQGRERTQAAQLAQLQAEGLRSLRDTLTWDEFETRIPAGVFHIDQTATNEWEVNGGSSGPYPLNGTPSIYSVSIDGNFVGTTPAGKLEAAITVTWERIGGGTDTTTIHTRLADQNTPIEVTP